MRKELTASKAHFLAVGSVEIHAILWYPSQPTVKQALKNLAMTFWPEDPGQIPKGAVVEPSRLRTFSGELLQ